MTIEQLYGKLSLLCTSLGHPPKSRARAVIGNGFIALYSRCPLCERQVVEFHSTEEAIG